MTQFSVDPSALRDMAGRLRGLQEEFEGLEDTVGGYESAVGSEELAGKLESFADNWSDKRKQVAEQMQNVAGYAAAAADAYTQHEHDLAGQVQAGGGRREASGQGSG